MLPSNIVHFFSIISADPSLFKSEFQFPLNHRAPMCRGRFYHLMVRMLNSVECSAFEVALRKSDIFPCDAWRGVLEGQLLGERAPWNIVLAFLCMKIIVLDSFN